MREYLRQSRPLRAVYITWLKVLRCVLHWWVRSTVVPEDQGELGLREDQPVFYMLDTYALTSLLIVEEISRKQGWPSLIAPFRSGEVELRRSYGASRRFGGLVLRRLKKRRHSELLKELVDATHAGRLEDVQILPVTVLIGRAPEKEESITKILFSENWDVGGRSRRLVSTIVNGRSTFVQFGKPISLRRLVSESADPALDLRRLSRVLRVHFKRVRTAAIGPDRSHRRTLIERVVRSESVRNAIEAKSRRDGIPVEKAERIARKYALEIAADYSYAFIRIADIVFTWFLNRIYRGIRVYHFSRFRDASPGHEIIYVPCHRSHIDYMLLSYILYHRGFVPPHVGAGINLNMFIIGPLIRRGGAFFLRRSFRSKPLYAAVFNEYVSTIIARGVALEYFIEGTRSRTGRLLPARAGMLSITVRAFLRNRERPVLFQPVYIGYERLAEGNAYISELSGQQKKPESLSDFRNVINILRKNYGEVHVSFGEPVHLNHLLEQHNPDWADEQYVNDTKPPWLSGLVDDLAGRIMVNINRAANVNAVNLLACSLLASRKQALDEDDLAAMIGIYQRLLHKTAYSEYVTVTEMTPQQVVDYGLELGVIQRQEHKLGNIILTDRNSAVLLTYFRNNVAHLLAMSSWIACCFLNNQRVRKARIRRLAETVYPFLRRELNLPWSDEEVPAVIQRSTDALVRLGLLRASEDSLQRGPGGSDQTYYLRLMAQALVQIFERYYITIAVLAKNGSGKLTRQQLEQMCILTAQRISLLHEFDAPEFSDRALFKQFIESLQETGMLSRNDDGHLVFDKTLEAFARESKLILEKEIRHTIIQITPQIPELEEAERAEAA